ncbi:hypothetical protein WJX73_010736 [Symbiochloris irregularis]|uniref:Uncharacterized protein n=1 Tax=Symbiochloris irregularis TaxID=706552 RepID=A0AAW1Q3V1_9CHLO
MQQGSRPNSDEVGSALDGMICGLHLVEQRLTILDQEMVLVAPRSVDDVIDLYIGTSDKGAVQDTQDPYWCRAWPSAVALAELIFKHPTLVKGKEVLELGCGLGIAGLAAALAGAQQSVPTEAGQVSAATVDWQALETLHSLHPQVVVAADVMYDSLAPALLAKVLRHLGQRGSPLTAFIADPEERTKHHRREFLSLVSSGPDASFTVESNQVHKVLMDGITSSIRIMQLKARS